MSHDHSVAFSSAEQMEGCLTLGSNASIKGTGCAPGGCRDQQDTLSLGGAPFGDSLVLT